MLTIQDSQIKLGTIQIFWEDEARTILHNVSDGQIDWETFTAAVNEMVEMVRKCDHPVYIINSYTEDYRSPPGNMFPRLNHFYDALPSNVRLHIYIEAATVDRMLLSIFTRVQKYAHLPIHHAQTKQEAFNIIRTDKSS